jgi:hypothetical protein
MTTITLKFPEEIPAQEAVQYLQDVFNPLKVDYLRYQENPGRKNGTDFVYQSGMTGELYGTKDGYVVTLRRPK